jgi:hypothetical protein
MSFNTLGLSMIVKNESEYIIQTLDTIIDYIDIISISDTGSTDNTYELIEEYLLKKNKEYILTKDTWVNFSHNRNIALERLYKKADYILLLDADEHCIIKDPNFKQKLSSYNNISYRLPCTYITSTNISSKRKLISGHLRFKYKYIIHEQLYCEKIHDIILLPELITIYHTRPTTQHKSEYYLKLLESALDSEPNNYTYRIHYMLHFLNFGFYKKAIQQGDYILNTIKITESNKLNVHYYMIRCHHFNKSLFDNMKHHIEYFSDKKLLEPYYYGMLILCNEKKYKKAYEFGLKHYKTNYKKDIHCFKYYPPLYESLYDETIEKIKKLAIKYNQL